MVNALTVSMPGADGIDPMTGLLGLNLTYGSMAPLMKLAL